MGQHSQLSAAACDRAALCAQMQAVPAFSLTAMSCLPRACISVSHSSDPHLKLLTSICLMPSGFIDLLRIFILSTSGQALAYGNS